MASPLMICGVDRGLLNTSMIMLVLEGSKAEDKRKFVVSGVDKKFLGLVVELASLTGCLMRKGKENEESVLNTESGTITTTDIPFKRMYQGILDDANQFCKPTPPHHSLSLSPLRMPRHVFVDIRCDRMERERRTLEPDELSQARPSSRHAYPTCVIKSHYRNPKMTMRHSTNTQQRQLYGNTMRQHRK